MTATKQHTGTKKTHKASNTTAAKPAQQKETQMKTAKSTKSYIVTKMPRKNPTAEELAYDAAKEYILQLPQTHEVIDLYNSKTNPKATTKSGERLTLICVSPPGPDGPDEVFDSGFTVGFDVGFDGGWQAGLIYARKHAVTK